MRTEKEFDGGRKIERYVDREMERVEKEERMIPIELIQ